MALLILFVLPVLAYGGPAVFGHPVLPGDDLTQNFPLRVLVGADLRHGHLPVFDPYIWSGAPLLGGWNAGAAYPLTWLFAFLPGSLAWSVGVIATSWAAGIGTFFFLRASRLGTVASWLGALTFAFAGAMTVQIVHFGLIAGMSWVPLELLALLRLSEDRSLRSRAGWTSLLALGVGLTILAGEPRAVDDALVVVALYALWQTVRRGRSCGWLLASTILGGLVGVGLGAVQWAPGAAAVASSQRAETSYYLFSSGSLAIRWLTLLGVPDLFGGSGSFGQPPFFATYNLTEVTGYVGVVPLVAAFGLLGRLRWRRPLPEWVVWHVVAAVGILLTLGGNTPLWHLLIHIPLFRDQRLQSRNMLIVDFALAVLLAYWADRWLATRAARPTKRPALRMETLLGMAGALAVVVIVVLALTWGAGFLDWLGLSSGAATWTGGLKPWLVPFLVIALLVVGMLFIGPSLSDETRQRLLVGIVVVDIVVFTLMAVLSVAPRLGKGPKPTTSNAPALAARATSTTPARSIASLGLNGRFAVYDPDLLYGNQLTVLGAPDLNVLTDTPSVLGYSSIVNGLYAAVTGSHQATGGGQDIFSPQAAADGALDELDTTVLFTPAEYLVTTPGTTTPAPAFGTGIRHLTPGSDSTWQFGMALSVTSVTVPTQGTMAGSGVQLGLLTTSGSTVWFPEPAVHPGDLEASLPDAVDALALVARASSSAVGLEAPTLTTSVGARLVANGQLQGVLLSPHWQFAGTDGSFAVFRNTQAAPAASLRALPGQSLQGASLRVASRSDGFPSSVSVSSPEGAEVVRSIAAIPGYKATWTPAGSTHSASVPVRRNGLVQVVDVPAGTGTLAWRYDTPHLHLGELLSAVAAVILAGLLAVAAFVRPRGRHSSSAR